MCFLTRLIPLTAARVRSRAINKTFPVFPLSFPEVTITMSFFLIRSILMSLCCFDLLSEAKQIGRGEFPHFLHSARMQGGKLWPHLYDFWRQGDNLHKISIPQFPGHRPKDARSSRVALSINNYRGITVKAQV